MKFMKASSILPLLVVLGLLPLIATGCAHALCVKIVDASTGKPLVGVSTSWQQYYHRYYHSGREGPTNLPPSGEDGVITFGKLHQGWTSYFVLACPGYSNVYGCFPVRGKLHMAKEISYFPPGRFAGEFY